MSAPVMPSLRFWRHGRNSSAQRRSWCTALIPTARCAWLKSCGAREDKPITFPLIFWKSASETSGRGEGAKSKGKERRAKSEGQRAKGKEQRVLICFALCPLPFAHLVARDGIEPPTPAFSVPLTESPKNESAVRGLRNSSPECRRVR